MASQLTQNDLSALSNYAANGDRRGYWSYLVRAGDPYAKLALGVVTNGTLEGYIANSYTSDSAAFKGITWTAEKSQRLGLDIMNLDLDARRNAFNSNDATRGLNLDVFTIERYHRVALESPIGDP